MKPLLFALCVVVVLAGCRSTRSAEKSAPPRVSQKHASTAAIDLIDRQLAEGPNDRANRLDLYDRRWAAVRQAVAYHGTTHRDAFYGSRAYWHTNSTRGIGWALNQLGDLSDPFYIDGRGNVLVTGDANADIEIAGNCIVHILGDLDATLDLTGVCEVVIAGRLTEDATIICDGQLELFVGGDSAGILGSTSSATIIIDGDAGGTIQCGAPAATVTVTGDLIGDVPPPKNKEAVLTLRVDGYTPTATMLDLAGAGFTRVNATLGFSDALPGLYPQDPKASRPTARWIVLEQRGAVGRHSD